MSGWVAACSAGASADQPPWVCQPNQNQVMACTCDDGTSGYVRCGEEPGPCLCPGSPGVGGVPPNGVGGTLGSGGVPPNGVGGVVASQTGTGGTRTGTGGTRTGTGGTQAGTGGTQAGTGGTRTGTGGTQTGTGGSADPPPPRGDLAGGARITRVDVYQAVDIPIMRDGTEVAPLSRNAPVVAGRPALVRAFVATDPGWQPRQVAGRLELNGSGGPLTLDDAKQFAGSSSDGDIGSTFNFKVPANTMTTDIRYSVSIVESAPGGVGSGSTAGARFPAQGDTAASPSSVNGPFQVTLVPLVQNGITPDLSPGRVDEYKNYIFNMYPVSSVEITVHAPVTPPIQVTGTGGGWPNMVQYVEQLRTQEPHNSRVYYFGVLTPANSFAQYCSFGCVAGLANAPQDAGPYGRSGVGIGFFPDGTGQATLTAAHELGHTLGRPHAPCGTQDAPPGFPYPGGGAGVWGYDMGTDQLVDPGPTKDIMGYCDPRWISDYTYKAMFERLSQVNLAGLYVSAGPSPDAGHYRVAILDAHGAASWGFPVDLPTGATGPVRDVRIVDGKGAVIRTVPGYFVPFSDLGGGSLLIAETDLSDPRARAVWTGSGAESALPIQ